MSRGERRGPLVITSRNSDDFDTDRLCCRAKKPSLSDTRRSEDPYAMGQLLLPLLLPSRIKGRR